MISSASAFLSRRSSATVSAFAAAMIAVVGVIDYLTGYDLSLGLFYTLSIAMLAWYASRRAAILGSVACAVGWFVANSLTAPEMLPQPVLLWNTGILFMAVAYPLSALRAAYRREREAARVDLLTGVSTSRAFYEQAELELRRAARVGYPLTLLYLDVDNFKAVNDSHGHAAGDELLRQIGHSLRGSLRATDLVGRLGGDEFGVLLVNVTEGQVGPVISKIETALAGSTPLAEVSVAVSIGIASLAGELSTLDALIAAADARMYVAKVAKARARGS